MRANILWRQQRSRWAAWAVRTHGNAYHRDYILDFLYCIDYVVMNTLHDRVLRVYCQQKQMAVLHRTESIAPYLSQLRNEMFENTYILSEVQALLDNTRTIDVYVLSSIELRVIGGTRRDQWICKKVCQRAAAIQQMYPTHPQRLIIWVFLTHAKRMMPVRGHVQPKHINGGYTYVHGSDIYVLRREEFPKVVLHEVIHHTIHHRKSWSPEGLMRLYETFHISRHKCDETMDTCSTILEPNEALVECWAEVIHLMFVSIDTRISFNNLWNAEQEYAFQQTKNLLNVQATHMSEWQEGTHSYSYIVLRTLLLCTFPKWAFGQLDTNAMTMHILSTWESPAIQQRLQQTKRSRSKVKSLRMTLLGDF